MLSLTKQNQSLIIKNSQKQINMKKRIKTKDYKRTYYHNDCFKCYNKIKFDWYDGQVIRRVMNFIDKINDKNIPYNPEFPNLKVDMYIDSLGIPNCDVSWTQGGNKYQVCSEENNGGTLFLYDDMNNAWIEERSF